LRNHVVKQLLLVLGINFHVYIVSAGFGRQPQNLSQVPNLMAIYHHRLTAENTTEAKNMADKIAAFLKDEVNLDGYEAFLFAAIFSGHQCFQDLIPLLLAASLLFEKEGGQSSAVANIGDCAHLLGREARNMIHQNIKQRQVLKDLVIPILHNMQNAIEGIKTKAEKTKCKNVVHTLFTIADVQKSIEDFEAAEKTYKKCLVRFEKTYLGEAKNQRAYADTLRFLEDLQMSRHVEADDCHTQAAVAHGKAKDIRGQKKRKRLSEKFKAKRVRTHANEM